MFIYVLRGKRFQKHSYVCTISDARIVTFRKRMYILAVEVKKFLSTELLGVTALVTRNLTTCS